MTYAELIERAMKGRSVNRAAKEMGLNQRSLDRYVKSERLPDFRTALILAREADVPLGETMIALAHEEARRNETKEIVTAGFRMLTNAVNRLFSRVAIA
ncbi:helix-turn-helix transcriptional regulator [Paraburkholderia sp. Ac-20336]|uniref:helix-turn-helix domain-containing protein n=1 Tax=Paraburkholderia sp. Ac-20336 TaxID=2703886 RepID=UPI00198121F7|nr:helix-turn-helix transcriptional regulator [Paraburkholderia sp. Ac-20336]MBN3802511.1 helix-turn-helix transcriptional regulator [Paraburkholderia sp. Ac-20336]